MEAEYSRPDWRQAVAALDNGAPANVSDLHAVLVAHLKDIRTRIAAGNTDIYKRFWNEDSRGKITTPKVEDSCRDVLIDLLRERLAPLGLIVEPEGHMDRDKRSDISVAMPKRKVLIEVKRDRHSKVWHAAETQLDRFYTWDPEALGFGVYAVLWFGDKTNSSIPLPPNQQDRPKSAAEMQQMLTTLIPKEKRSRLAIVVLDVSGATN
jgi:hypothetical protein